LRLQQVLINLGGNALKFTERGEVVVSVPVLDRRAVAAALGFAVRDIGIGIAAENLARIFSAITQAETLALNRRSGCGGLRGSSGLATATVEFTVSTET
jgi:signal transduction histidine kinase